MPKYLLPCLLAVAIAIAGACRAQPPAEPPTQRPTATIKDIMLAIVDPEADVLWNAVAIIVDASGTEEREPKTDEDWAELRRAAVNLVEAPNLLLVPGRRVARPGEVSENPNIELEPEAMQKLINDDPVTWRKMAYGLQNAMGPALKAIEEKNAKALFDAGEELDRACENCHQRYWYPAPSHSIWSWKLGAE
jgi:hypothetical protein